jgi:phosphoenolpyruvate carboxykinase (GTP)
MAMLAFCGYNMADYFGHWLEMGRKIQHPPRIFRVNWFRRDASGKFLWPGFGENMRVLQWIAQRCQGRASGVETPLGVMPRFEDLTWTGLEHKVAPAQFAELARVDAAAWKEELALHDELFGRFGARLPEALETRRGRMHEKLAA